MDEWSENDDELVSSLCAIHQEISKGEHLSAHLIEEGGNFVDQLLNAVWIKLKCIHVTNDMAKSPILI